MNDTQLQPDVASVDAQGTIATAVRWQRHDSLADATLSDFRRAVCGGGGALINKGRTHRDLPSTDRNLAVSILQIEPHESESLVLNLEPEATRHSSVKGSQSEAGQDCYWNVPFRGKDCTMSPTRIVSNDF